MSEPNEPPRSVVPPRKRRRPALSCEQCRKRKIKCDRTYPCGQCTLSKTAHCSYSPDSAGAIQHLNKRSSLPPAPGPSVYQNTLPFTSGLPSRPRDALSTASPNTQPSIDEFSPKPPLSSTGTSWHSPTSEHLHDDTSSKALLDRIQKLEERLAIANQRNDRQEDSYYGPQAQDDDLERSKPRERNAMASFIETQKGDLFFNPEGQLRGTFEQKGKLKGTVSKTRFFGQSHWMYSFGTFDKVACLKVNPKNNTPEFSETATGPDINELLNKCKAMSRAAKAGPHNQFLMNPNYRESVPPRPICDKLLELYFRTHESSLRIFHIPTFWKECEMYWQNPAGTSSTIIIKMLLAMSIGACFYQDNHDQDWHNQALQWIFAGQSWLASPFEKGRLHISGLQIHCLVIAARLINAVAGDLVWISTGSLLRTAFQMGFHRDPKHLPPMLPLHAELRRRLWATVLELNVQGALDSGMPALIHLEDFDTEPPSNFDDADLDEHMTCPPQPKPRDIYTQSSLQIMLLESLPTRLQIVKHCNNFRSDPSYEEVLALGSTITKFLREHNTFINTVNAAYFDAKLQDPATPKPYISRMHRNNLDLCIRRFLLAIHRPFAAKAQIDLRYYFSRKVCLDCAMTMLSYPSSDAGDPSIEPGKQDDFTRLKTVSGGFQKGLLVHAAMVIFSELLTQLDEESTFTEQSRAAREPLKRALQDIVDLSALRIQHAENNIKGHLFISVVLAQIEAVERGIPADKMVLEAARRSAEVCMGLLSKRISVTASDDEYTRHVENGGTVDEVGVQQQVQVGNGNQEMGMDTMMQDWTMDSQFFNMPDSWLISGWEDNQFWGLQA